MTYGWIAVYYRELLILRRRLTRLLASMSVSPLLYFIAPKSCNREFGAAGA